MSEKIVKVRYEGVSKVIEDLQTISNDNVAIGKKFEEMINSFKNDKILSSKVITPAMEEMINKINDLNAKMKENCDAYCDYLSTYVIQGYSDTDNDSSELWSNLSNASSKVGDKNEC